MVAGKALIIILSSAALENQYLDHARRVALRALEKGHSVELFLYGDSICSLVCGPSARVTIPAEGMVRELIGKGARVSCCRSGSSGPDRSPITDPSEHRIDGVKLAEISELVNSLALADKVLSFGGA